MEKRRVVITGMGAVTPLGLTLTDSWAAVKRGECGIGPITLYDPAGQKVSLAAEVKNFDPAAFLDKKEARKLDRCVQFALSAADQAVASSGLQMEQEDAARCAVFFASGIGGFATVQAECMKGAEKGYDRVSPFFIPMVIANMAAGNIAIRHGFGGMCTCPVTACASGTNAVGYAFRHIRDGYAEVALAGGTEAAITPLAMGGFTSLHALHTGDDPACASVPFDARRSGFVMGEGAGALLLEEYEHAVRRGATILAELAGYGASGDAYHITSPSPDGEAAARAILNAIEDAGLTPADVDYINAHGTSTPLNEKYETIAIKKAFGDEAYNVKVSSTKSMTGHLLGGAAAVEAIACVMAVREGIVPPTIGYQEPDPECDLDITPNKAVEMPVNVAISNSLGFGGHNACILIKKV